MKKIIQIVSLIESKGDKYLDIYGLGDDGNVYHWDEKIGSNWYQVTDLKDIEEY